MTSTWLRQASRVTARILAGGALVVVGLELLVRVAGLGGALVWEPDPELGWWHVAGASTRWTSEGDGQVRINSHRMRDVERPATKPAGVFRIALFGDSMTEAVQVNLEQTFGALIESRLRQQGLRVEVLNFGVNGYSPLQGLLLYRKVQREFVPDLVIHNVFLDNDVADGHPGLATGQAGAPFVVGDTDGPLRVDFSRAVSSHADYHAQPMYAIRRWSATYRAISAIRWQMKDRARLENARESVGGVPRRYLLYSTRPSHEWDRAWRTLERIERTFAAEVRANGQQFCLVSVPAGQVVDSSVWASIVAANETMRGGSWDVAGPESRFSGIAASIGAPIVLPLARFSEYQREEPLFFDRIGHLTPAGHELMATYLVDRLNALGLVPRAGF